MHSNALQTSSRKADQFQESVIREMSRLAAQHNAVNLAQGLPDFPCPPELQQAAAQAIFDHVNQYSITWGDRLLREAIAEKAARCLGMKVDPESEITVTCGSTEATVAAMLALLDPDDEVIVFEPFYENYAAESILCGARLRHVPMHPPDWTFNENDLERAFNNRTRVVIVNTPHNPTGKVYRRDELELIAKLCQKWGALAFTDEIYEHILYEGASHIALGSLPGMEDRTVTINGLSKTYSVTGWRVGWAIAPEPLTLSIRKVHDFLTIGAPSPLQRAGVTALKLGQEYYDALLTKYGARRQHMLETLDLAGIPYYRPSGAYYVFCDISKLGFGSDIDFTLHLVKDIGVAVVPGTSFFGDSDRAHNFVRFCFARKPETLDAARSRLIRLKK